MRFPTSKIDFNPRTPCGVRPLLTKLAVRYSKFQSTHPLRGATSKDRPKNAKKLFQSTHPLRGATTTPMRGATPRRVFQSTHPLRGATAVGGRRFFQHLISIHAPLAGCDISETSSIKIHEHFNPRTPCGVRPAAFRHVHVGGDISIHAPLAGCDRFSATTKRGQLPFQSTHPLRGATAAGDGGYKEKYISIHAPLAGCDIGAIRHDHIVWHFNPRTPCGVRQEQV